MNQYFSQEISESLQEIAKKTRENGNKAASAADVAEHFRGIKIEVSSETSAYLKRQREYRKKAASANYGTY